MGRESDGAATLESLGLESAILPLLPMLYVAWADGTLTAAELAAIRQRVSDQPWVPDASRAQLRAWLDPEHPPSPQRLQALLTAIRWLARAVPHEQRESLAQLGLELARETSASSADQWAGVEALAALDEIERALGVVGSEACAELLSDEYPVAAVRTPPSPTVDVFALTRFLDGSRHETRAEVRALLREQPFRYQNNQDTDSYQEAVLEWCRILADRGLGATAYPQAYGGSGDLARFVTVFETLAHFDLSLVVKFGVQFGLFGGSIHQLGTERHHVKYLRAAGTLELPGCFAMTETGHGSNVRDIATVARFDPDTDEFIVHTPENSARKDYIGNAARHGRLATVFAQLEVDRDVQGVHAFLVPMREDDGRLCDGVRIEDCGLKLGLNGVDNGRIWFDHVRIPRENLLNRFADVDEAGTYTSSIANASKRFFTMLGTLVGGRISVAGAALSAAKSGLTIAIRYADQRRQFGPAGAPESLLLDYLSHQRRLLPALATTYALDVALEALLHQYVARPAGEDRRIEVVAAGMKAFSSWHTIETLQECREACGGAGYLTVNRFADLRADTDVFATFEGDNTVLLQLVAKGLLTEFRHEFGELRFFGIVKHVAQRAATAVAELNPVVTRRTDSEHLLDVDFHRAAFAYREERLLVSVATRLKRLIEDGASSFDAFNMCQDHLVAAAWAHVERLVLDECANAVDRCQDEDLVHVLTPLLRLFALSRIERDRGWFLESGYLEGRKSKAIRAIINQLCSEIRPHATTLVDGFAIPAESLAAPIGLWGSQV